MGLILSWSFSIVDYVSPWLENPRPATAAERDALVSVDILDDSSGVDLSSLDAYMNGVPIFAGPSTFIPPFNGSSSAITPTIVDGYNGYHLVIDKDGTYPAASSHTVRVIGSDAYGNSFDESFIFSIASITNIADVSSNLYEITLDVTFDTPMLEDDNLRNPANYHFNNGMYARKVDVIANNKVRLWVELYYGRDDFVLTVDPSIKNTDGYGLQPDADSYGFAPFESDATFTNFNAMVRTWHESTIVGADSQRIYLAGVKGIDIFRKESATRFSRWGQIFDEYGIDAMFVANYPSDLEITDSVAPVLEDPIPPPSSFAPADTRISFKVRDETTAVEITTLRVYIEGELAFSGGYDGWQNNWSGRIEVEHHQLSVEMWRDILFDTGSIVTVRIVAQDLMGNELDTSYNFSVLIPIGGFGGVPFGTSPFGGA